jgi:DNA-binding transcriptional ArsR family regulator
MKGQFTTNQTDINVCGESSNGIKRARPLRKDLKGQGKRAEVCWTRRQAFSPTCAFFGACLDRQVITCIYSVMADLFEALVAPARRTILDVLLERDGQTLFEICARLTMKHNLTLTRQAISQHLDVLEAAGLVRTRRESRYKYHYLDTAPLNAIVKRWLTPKRKADAE